MDFGEARVFGDDTIAALGSLDESETRRLQAFISLHEDEVRDDCSDGPTVALLVKRDAMYRHEFNCCGWHESCTSIGGHDFVIGSNRGH